MDKYMYKISAAGRVNIIGEHIDYCGGKVFPAALSFKNTVYIRPNNTNKINIKWTTLPDEVTLDINQLSKYAHLKYGNYQAGSAYVWQQMGHKIIGCDMLQDCSVPFGSGLSSSAAIEVSTIAALATLAGENINPVEIALAAQKAEREYIGMNCGIMDQYASACGKKGMAMLLDCKSLECEYVPFDLGEFSLVITNSNKPHNLVESKYNERFRETKEALKILQQYADISCLADLSYDQFKHHTGPLKPNLRKRVEHVIKECERVNLAKKAMIEGDMNKLGNLLNESHESLSILYEVTGKELDSLAHAAMSHYACLGSRMTGGGFGGCTISLVRTTEINNFKEYVSNMYKEQTGYEPTFYQTEIGDGIIVEKL